MRRHRQPIANQIGTRRRKFSTQHPRTGIGKPDQANTAAFENKLRISPNPVSDIATVEFFVKNQGNYTAKVYDLMGKLHREIILVEKQEDIKMIENRRKDYISLDYYCKLDLTVILGGENVEINLTKLLARTCWLMQHGS